MVKIGSLYYLFITLTDCKHHPYHNTLVFTSEDPTDFGTYTEQNDKEEILAKLHAHAPEVILDADGQWHITTCGWRGYNTPVEGGVGISKLEWA